jgi:hypothetical protein
MVIFFSHAVNISLRSGSTITYLTNPPRCGPERSEMILLVYKSQIFKLLVPVEINIFAWAVIDKIALLCASILPKHSHLFIE